MERRIVEHRRGHTASTRRLHGFMVEWKKDTETLQAARNIERTIKNKSSPALIAQSAEQGPLKPKVEGSIPSGRKGGFIFLYSAQRKEQTSPESVRGRLKVRFLLGAKENFDHLNKRREAQREEASRGASFFVST